MWLSWLEELVRNKIVTANSIMLAVFMLKKTPERLFIFAQ